MFRFFKTNKKSKRIAIVSPLLHGSVVDVNTSFHETLQKSREFSADFYQCIIHGTPDEMFSQAEEIAQKNFDLIFCFGTSSTIFLQKALAIKNRDIPLVFCGISNPVEKGLIASLESSYNNLTGMSSRHSSYAAYISLLLHVKPHVKNIAIFHNSLEPWLKEDSKEVKQTLSYYDIKSELIMFDNPHNIEKTLKRSIKNFDTVFALRDNVVMAGMKELVALCNKEGKTIFSSEIYSPRVGAAVGYGSSDSNVGVECALIAHEILTKEKKPHEIPIQHPDQLFKLIFNRKTMLQQGLIFLGSEGK